MATATRADDAVFVTVTLKCGTLRQAKLGRGHKPPPRMWCPSDEYDCEVVTWTSSDLATVGETVRLLFDAYPPAGNWDDHPHVTAVQSPANVRRNVRAHLAATTDGHCTYCGTALPAGWHIDHILPQSRGGGHHWQNLTPACPTCNLDKGARTPEEWHR